MQLPKIYAGKILSVDLTTGRTETLDTADYAERFLGGRGFAAKIYWDQVPSDSRAYDPVNRIIMSLGPMAGLPAIGASRWGIYAKSPFPLKEHFCYGSLGGYFGAGLKSSGCDGLVVHGKAPRPVLLRVAESGGVTLTPAGELWGKSTTDTMAALAGGAGSVGSGGKVLAIGPAGENLVPFATVFADGDASCGGGMGAVMGSKNLKGIVVEPGSFKPKPADLETLRAIEKEIRAYGRGNVKVWGIDFMEHGEKTKKLPCAGCMAKCLRVSYTADNGKRGKYMCQSRFFYMNHAWGFYGSETDVPFLANRLCDEYGLDTWEVQTILEWVLRCHEEGVISERESGLDISKVGSLEFIRDFLEIIISRRGFGGILAGGADRASMEFGPASRELLRHNDPYDPRYCTINTMLIPFEKREPIQQLHEAGLLLAQWASKAKGVPEAHITSNVLRGIARQFWGSVEAADFSTLEGKARAALKIQDRQFAKECLGLCDWMYPLIDNPNSESHVGDPTVESRLFSAASGLRYEEAALYRVGERVFNLQRAIMLREGHRALRDDVLPDEYHSQPLETHVADPECLVPVSGDNTASLIGNRVRMTDFIRLREEYFELRGWDGRSGLQSPEGLAALDLPEVGEELIKSGLAAKRARPASPFRRYSRKRYYRRNRLDRDCAVASARGSGDAGTGGGSIRGGSIRREELAALLNEQCLKFGNSAIAHNFSGWNKIMQYYFPDIDEYWVIRMADGKALPPERLDAATQNPEIHYEMDTETLRAMTRGEISGFKAYQQRRLKLKASFTDMMKLQSLNKA